jgi:hypothetical protein
MGIYPENKKIKFPKKKEPVIPTSHNTMCRKVSTIYQKIKCLLGSIEVPIDRAHPDEELVKFP